MIRNCLLLLLIAFVLTGCGSQKVIVDYDDVVDFNQYKAYAIDSVSGNKMAGLDQVRFQRIIKSHLDSIGFTPSKTPDFLVTFQAIVFKPIRSNPVGMGLSNGQAGIAVSTDVFFGAPKDVESVSITFTDAKSNQVIWKGNSQHKIKAAIKPKERVEELKKIITNILKEFPPK